MSSHGDAGAYESVVVFGDSYSDGGLHGFGIVDMEHAEVGGFPAEAQRIPMEQLKEKFGAYYPFPQYGYVDHMATNGKTWAQALEDVTPGCKVYNFSHISASACQDVKEEQCVIGSPQGFQGLWTDSGLGLVRPRGVAQQLQQAMELRMSGVLPEDIFQNSLVAVYIGTNDFLFTWGSSKSAVGHSSEDAASCALVANYRAIYNELVHHLGVPAENIVFGGLPAVELIPKTAELYPDTLCEIKSQVNAVNAELGKIAPRWHVAEWMRKHMLELEPTIICRVYAVLGNLQGPDDLPVKPPTASGTEKWFDEVHPSAAIHQKWAEHFSKHFLCGADTSSRSPRKTSSVKGGA